MKINSKEIIGNEFAYDGCHKMYVIEDEIDKQEAIEAGYEILDISEIEKTYLYSCELRFIHNWKLCTTYVSQFENAIFE